MNRLKKVIQKVNKRNKKAKAKLAPQNKPKYISKADREKLDSEPTESNNTAETDSNL